MGKYIHIHNELKPHDRVIGTCDGKLTDFLDSIDLINPLIEINGRDLQETNIQDDYIIKDTDNIVIVNRVAGGFDPISFLITFALTYALNTLLAPKPSIPKQVEQKPPETEFTVNTSQNQARSGEPIPECFGTFVRTPDIISSTYRRYDNDDKQYLYMLLCVGVGENTINDIFIEDTNINDFPAGVIEHRIYKNATAHTGNDKIKDDWNTTYSDPYFRDIVITAKEIQDYKLTVADPFNEIQINPSDTLTDLLEFDITFPNGLYTQQSDGTLGSRSVNVRFTYTNSSLTTTTQTVTITDNTRDPIRKTYSYAVAPDYYTAKTDRITADSTDTKVQDTVYLDAMKAYLINNDATGNGFIEYGDMTLLAIKIKATEGVSSKGQFKVKVNATRDNLAQLDDIMEYIWTSDNGGRQILSGIDLPVMTEAYNNVISQRTTVFQSLQSVGTSQRYNVYPSFNVITARKDVIQPIQTMLFSEVNIVQGSLKVTMSAKDDTDHDGVRVVYRNPDTFENDFATYPLDASFPEDIPLDGVTDSVFAQQQAEFLYKQSIRRNIKYEFDTELDGFVPSLFDRCGLSHPALGKVQAGTIIGYDLVAGTIQLNETLKEDYTTPKILFRDRLGQPSFLYDVLTVSNRTLTLDISTNPLPTDLYIGDDEQKTIYQIGDTVDFMHDIFISEIKPKSNNTISVLAWNYTDSIYT